MRTFKNLTIFVISVSLSLVIAEIIFSSYLDFHHRPFLERTEGDHRIFTTNPDCWNFREDIRFRMPKPDNDFRIFAFGGSVTEGGIFPGYKANFLRFLSFLLEGVYPERSVEIINLGRSGESSSEVVNKANLALQYSPDLYIVYSGNNEFLKYIDANVDNGTGLHAFLMKSALYSSIHLKVMTANPTIGARRFDQKRQLADSPVGSSAEFDEIERQYADNIEKVIKFCKEHEIGLIIIGPAGNYAHWQPNRSVRQTKFSSSEKGEWYKSYNGLRESASRQDWKSAMEHLLACRRIDSTFAETEFIYGELLMKQEKYDSARRMFKRAADLDGAPIMARTSMLAMLSALCNTNDIPYIDANKLFESRSQGALTDSTFFVDAHHPSVKGDILLARQLKQMIRENEFLGDNDSLLNLDEPSDKELLAKCGLSATDSLGFYVGRANWYLKQSITRWDLSRRLGIAKSYIDNALSISPGDARALVCRALWACIRGYQTVARQDLLAVRQSSPQLYRQINNSAWVTYVLDKCSLEL